MDFGSSYVPHSLGLTIWTGRARLAGKIEASFLTVAVLAALALRVDMAETPGVGGASRDARNDQTNPVEKTTGRGRSIPREELSIILGRRGNSSGGCGGVWWGNYPEAALLRPPKYFQVTCMAPSRD